MGSNKPDLMIRIPKIKNELKMNDDPKPTINIELTTYPELSITPYPANISTKDVIYFKFKKNFKNSTAKTSLLYNIYTELGKSSIVPPIVREHFYPLNTINEKWWNYTHSYIYFHKELCQIIRHLVIIDIEAPLSF